MRSAYIPAIAMALCVGLASCTPVKVPEQIGNSLRSLQSELAMGRANIVSTTESLRDVRDNKGANIRPQIATFNDDLVALESKAGGIQAVGAISKDKTTAYFAQWEQQISQIEDKNLAEASQDRRQAVMDAYEGLKRKIQSLRDAYRPYYASLVDVRTFLSADMTAQGVNAARPAMDKVLAQAPEVLNRLDDVNKAINDMIAP